jgi:hypothetical protein
MGYSYFLGGSIRETTMVIVGGRIREMTMVKWEEGREMTVVKLEEGKEMTRLSGRKKGNDYG